MEYNFLQAKNNETIIDLNPDSKIGVYPNAKGGTEMMLEGLYNRLPKDLLSNFQIICSRVREVDQSKIPILWFHDTWDDPENTHLRDPESRKRFKGFVFVSHSQFISYNTAFGVPYGESVVLKNAIDPIEDHEKPTDRINIIYHTTPHRGLELLVPAFDHLSKQYPNLYLDVYSSFSIYGWPARDKPYEKIFDYCDKHPKITYHGVVSNQEVRQALKKAHIFGLPSIWPETSCIAAIEAMSAGCAVVCSDLGALPETVNQFGFMYRFTENKSEHVNRFATVLNQCIKNIQTDNVKNHLTFQKKYITMVHSWENRIPQWKAYLEEQLKNGRQP